MEAAETLEGSGQREAFERISAALTLGAKVVGRGVLWCVKAALMVICLAPAALVNYEMARGESTAWLAYAVVSVALATAGVLVAASNRLSVSSRIFGGWLALAFISQNLLNAVANSASMHERARDAAAYEFQEKGRLDTRLKELDAARAEQVAIAGNASASTIESDIRQKKIANQVDWQGTQGCTPQHVTWSREKEFCGAIEALNKRLEAAKQRDKIDADRAALTAKDVRPVLSRIDSQITALVNALGVFGVEVDKNGREVVASAIDWQRVWMLELMSSFGPELVLLLFLAFDPRSAAERHVIEEARRAAKLEARKAAAKVRAEAAEVTKPIEAQPVRPDLPEIDPAQLESDPQVQAFLTRATVRAPGAKIKPADFFEAWKADCAQQGIEPGSQRAFSDRVKLFVHREKRHNRISYIGVALRERGEPHLRAVS